MSANTINHVDEQSCLPLQPGPERLAIFCLPRPPLPAIYIANCLGAAGGGAEAAGGVGITGIKGLASRELTYRLSFMACSVQARRPAPIFYLLGYPSQMGLAPARSYKAPVHSCADLFLACFVQVQPPGPVSCSCLCPISMSRTHMATQSAGQPCAFYCWLLQLVAAPPSSLYRSSHPSR